MILLILGLITIAFPLYMTIVIAFKQPSEMTNSISGILSLPESFSLSNFKEAMKVTDFWNSLRNSVLTVVLSIVIHSLMGYAVGRNKAHSKFYNFVYLFIVSGMFVPFAILMMPLAKQTAEMGLGNWVGVIILYVVFYMPMNVLLYSGYLTNIPIALEEAARVDGASTWRTYWKVIFPIMKPMHATVAVITALSVWNDVMTPLVIMAGTGQNTLPLAQLNFQTQFGTNYNLAFASYLLALIPIVIFYVICQKQILNGVVNGKIKDGTRRVNMGIEFENEKRIFTLQTDHTTYQFQADAYGFLLHLYYGKTVYGGMDYLLTYYDRGFSANPYDANQDRTYSMDALPQEFPTSGTGDFRSPALTVKNSDGTYSCDLRYKSHRIINGKYSLPGLPAVYATEDEAQTLEILMEDAVTKVQAVLLYGVLPKYDIITRSVKIINQGEEKIHISKAASACLDFVSGDYDLISFYGRHAMERSLYTVAASKRKLKKISLISQEH